MYNRMRKNQLILKAKECGCLLLNTEEKLEIRAPIGKIFSMNLHHTITYYTNGWLRSQLYEEIVHDMRNGVIDCPDHVSINPKCEICELYTEIGTNQPEDTKEFEIWYTPDTK